MSLTLRIDGSRWREHLRAVVSANPGISPVLKGNGYCFGIDVLAREAAALDVDSVAVGTMHEVQIAEKDFLRDILVLQPWHPELGALGSGNDRVIRTVSHPEAVAAVAMTDARVVIELRTSMQRHGIEHRDIDTIRARLPKNFEGFSLHLALAGDIDAEIDSVAAAVAGFPLWVSHLVGERYERARKRHSEVDFRTRVGTALWLGDRQAFRVTATVLDRHALVKASRFGYRQQKLRSDSTLLVVSGGTSHGVGLEAPKPIAGIPSRAKIVGIAALAADGRNLSPFTVAGKQRWFAEPPHMQVSMVLLPKDVAAPDIGDEVSVDVRMTATTFDDIVGL